MFNPSLLDRVVFVVALSLLACAKGRPLRQDASVDGAVADVATDSPTVEVGTGDTSPDVGPRPDGDSSPDGGAGDGGGDNGQGCVAGAECRSGACVDGVCCESACTEKCLACTAALTGMTNGLCAPAKAGLNPHGSCTMSAPATCGDDGTCDGSGGCRKFGSNQLCTAAACAATTFSPARTCSGMGICAPATAIDCGPYPCALTGCATPCIADAECLAESYCSGGTCKARKSNGDACAAKNECGSGFCIDGVCCQSECTGSCVSCAEADTGQKSGTCQPVGAGQDPADDCATDPAAMCGRDGTCDGRGACRKYDRATKCADAVCVGTMFTPARTCASGACAPATVVDCKEALCTTAGCGTACSRDADCAASAYCAGTSCAAKTSNGNPCTGANQCASNACVDGVCCETTCAGSCYACVASKTGQSSGKCAPVSAGTDMDNDCTAEAASTCGAEGTCDGAGACKKWTQGTQCAAAVCNTAGNYVSARTCDGLGTCGAATTDLCAPSVCATTGCMRICTNDANCVGNSYCATGGATGGMCAAKKNPGSACGGASQCLSGFCVDGVCCNNACNGVCVSCRAADNGQAADGTCANVTAGADPAMECAAGATTCGLDGTCGGGKCRVAPATVSCAGAACVNGASNASATFTAAKLCDGNGTCPTTGSSSACPGNVLCASASACKPPTCAVDADCIGGFYCATGTCKAKGGLGAACAGPLGGNQCASNNCSSDLVCCSSACISSCQGCTVANTAVATGTCAPRPSASQCNGACGVGFAVCGTSCVGTSWNFDQGSILINGSPYGWRYTDPDREFPQVVISYVSGVSHTAATNRGALGVFLPADAGSGAPLIFGVDTCAGGLNLGGKTITAWVMRSAAAAATSDCSFLIGGLGGVFVGTITVGTAANIWTKMSGVIPSVASTSSLTTIDMVCGTPLTDPVWAGTLYVDDVSLSP